MGLLILLTGHGLRTLPAVCLRTHSAVKNEPKTIHCTSSGAFATTAARTEALRNLIFGSQTEVADRINCVGRRNFPQTFCRIKRTLCKSLGSACDIIVSTEERVERFLERGVIADALHGFLMIPKSCEGGLTMSSFS